MSISSPTSFPSTSTSFSLQKSSGCQSFSSLLESLQRLQLQIQHSGGKVPVRKTLKHLCGPFWSFVKIKKELTSNNTPREKDGSLIHYEHSSHHIKHQKFRNKEKKVLKLRFTSLYTIS